jgi:hypothetical protein
LFFLSLKRLESPSLPSCSWESLLGTGFAALLVCLSFFVGVFGPSSFREWGEQQEEEEEEEELSVEFQNIGSDSFVCVWFCGNGL